MTSSGFADSAAAVLEAALQSHPAVRRIAVVEAGRSGERQWIVYVLCGAHEVDDCALRAYLASKISAEVLAALRFVMLGPLFREPAGWRRPSHAAPGNAGGDEAGLRRVAEIVTGLCANVLKLEQVDPADNFIDLGGQSLAAIKLVERIELVLQVTIPLQSLFESATLMDVAQIVLDKESHRGRTGFIATILERVLAN